MREIKHGEQALRVKRGEIIKYTDEKGNEHLLKSIKLPDVEGRNCVECPLFGLDCIHYSTTICSRLCYSGHNAYVKFIDLNNIMEEL